MVKCVLERIYEQEFCGFSYGFRAGCSAHDALDQLSFAIERGKTNFVVDADIRKFFDKVNHQWLMRFLEHRIGDQRVLRLIRKWLRAGVMQDGLWQTSELGTPQGAVISNSGEHLLALRTGFVVQISVQNAAHWRVHGDHSVFG